MARRERSRARYFPATTQVVRSYNSLGVLTSTNTDAIPAQVRFTETMNDDPSPYRGDKVMAHKIGETLSRVSLVGWHDAGGAYNTQQEAFLGFPEAHNAYGSLPFPSMSAAHSWAGLPIDPTAAVNAAAASYQPIAEQFSLANAVFEFRDIRNLYNRLQNAGAALSRRRWRTNSDGNTVNAFLEANFGIIPLIADIKAVAAAYYRILDRLNFLKKSWGRPTTMRHRFVYKVADATPTPWVMSSSGFQNRTVVTGTVYVLSQSMKVLHRLEGLDSLYGVIRLANLYSGLNKPFKIAWNAIPFSFVVDWVVNVSSILDKLALPVFTGQYQLYDPWWSLKASCFDERQFLPIAAAGNPVQNYLKFRVTRYLRVPGVPPVTYVNIPSWYKLLLGVALGWSRRPTANGWSTVANPLL